MRRLSPPFLELGFYFASTPEPDAFVRIFMALLNLGAEFTGEARVHYGAGIRNTPFAYITDDPLPELITLGTTALERALADPNVRVVQLYVDGAVGIARDTAEIVSYVSITPEAARTDRHPLAIRTEGALFSGSLRQQFAGRAKNAGGKAYRRMRSLIEVVNPAYAAITSEIPLECPADLRRDPRSYAFRDFFVSETFLGTPNLVQIRELFQGAYIEEVGDGLYVSSTKEFNPKGINFAPNDTVWHSTEVAKLIASV